MVTATVARCSFLYLSAGADGRARLAAAGAFRRDIEGRYCEPQGTVRNAAISVVFGAECLVSGHEVPSQTSRSRATECLEVLVEPDAKADLLRILTEFLGSAEDATRAVTRLFARQFAELAANQERQSLPLLPGFREVELTVSTFADESEPLRSSVTFLYSQAARHVVATGPAEVDPLAPQRLLMAWIPAVTTPSSHAEQTKEDVQQRDDEAYLPGLAPPDFAVLRNSVLAQPEDEWPVIELSTSGFMCQRLVDLMNHEAHGIDLAGLSLERWEQALMNRVADPSSAVAKDGIASLQPELARLTQFVGLSRVDQRRLQFRALDGSTWPTSERENLREAMSRWDDALAGERGNLRQAYDLLTSSMTAAQLRAAEAAQAATDRLQWSITLVTSLLVAPALIVSVYGANLRELSDGARGSMLALVADMATAAVVTLAVFQLLSGRHVPPRPWNFLVLAVDGIIVILVTVLAYLGSVAWSSCAAAWFGLLVYVLSSGVAQKRRHGQTTAR